MIALSFCDETLPKSIERTADESECKALHLGKKNQQEIYILNDHEKKILSPAEKVTGHLILEY